VARPLAPPSPVLVAGSLKNFFFCDFPNRMSVLLMLHFSKKKKLGAALYETLSLQYTKSE